MEATTSAAWLATHRTEVTAARDGLRRVELAWSWGRLGLFVLIVASLMGFAGRGAVEIAAPAIATVLFLASVRRHRYVRAQRELEDRQLTMVEESRRRAGGHVVLIRSLERPADAPETGARVDALVEDGTTWELTPQEWDDLDLYAPPVGVFGLLNRASTVPGARRLRDMVEHPMQDRGRIAERQAAVRWLDEQSGARVRLMAAAARLRGKDGGLASLCGAVRMAAPLPSGRAWAGLRIWSVMSFAAFAYAMGKGLQGSSGYAVAGLGLLGINALIFQSVRRVLKAALRPWEGTSEAAESLREAAQIGAAELPKGEILGTLRAAFEAAAEKHAMPRLCRQLPWNEAGGPVRDFFNALVFYDVHVAAGILACAVARRDAILRGAAALVELEALASLATFAWEQPESVYAEFGESGIAIEAGRHPLIEPSHVVANDLRLTSERRTWIMTGSNMAGKSTFLRMAGINVLLAQMGTRCAARRMTYVPTRLITDLRARDNLAREESYFLAEVRQVRRMVMPPAGDAPVFGLIDEPFRGTNSQERAAASRAVMAHLIESGGYFLVATHEQQLTELADGRAAANYHFRENLTDAGPTFDYRIREGRATVRNALRVMEREGFPESMMRRAREWAGGA